MKSRKVPTEEEGPDGHTPSAVGTPRKNSEPPQSMRKLLVTIGSEWIFYAGAWCLSLWVMYSLSRFARLHGSNFSHRIKVFSHQTFGGVAEGIDNSSALVLPHVQASELHLDVNEVDDGARWLSGTIFGQSIKERESRYLLSPPPPPPLVKPPLLPPLPLLSVPPPARPSAAPAVPPTLTRPPPFQRWDASEGANSKVDLLPRRETKETAVSAGSTERTIQRSNLRGVTSGSSSDKNELVCMDRYRQHRVKPGKSWGTMNKQQQAEWMARRCDQYFCAPDKMEGRGVYDCKAKTSLGH